MIARGASSAPIEEGRRIARILRGVWRGCSQPLSVSPGELAQAGPSLAASGAAAITWWRVGHTALETGPAASCLRDPYRLSALQDVVHQDRLRRVAPLLRAAGVDAVLAKGWAVARLYPEPGLRPYGDLDFYVRPEHLEAARAALRRMEKPEPVDLHRGFPDLPDRTFDELHGRSRTVDLGGVEIRLLAPEDHLHLLCLHLLRHGAWRPLWLCDVGVILDGAAALDWEYFFHAEPWRLQATLCTLRLAQELLDARLDGTPIAERAPRLPSWMVPAVLREWGRGSGRREPLRGLLRRPRALLPEARRHWPNAVEATAGVRAPFNEQPRLPYQLAFSITRAARLVADLVRSPA